MRIVNRRASISTLFGGALSLRAQQQDDIVLRIDVDLVNIAFSVRNKNNALVPSLTKDDFTVFEDGKQQTIKSFTRETDLPLTIGVLVDVSGSQQAMIPEEKHAAGLFFEKVLRQKDMAFLISFGADARLLQDSTNSIRLLKRGLDDLRLNAGVSGIHPGPVPTSKQKGTILYDAVYMAADEKLKSEVGRKAIVVISDGVDYGSEYKLRDAIEKAHKCDTMIYSIYYADPRMYGGFGGGDGDLRKMSEETGGRVFHVSRSNRLEEIFTQIQQEMRSQYMLAYSSSNERKDGGFRKLELRTKDKSLKIQARKGYYAPKQ
ncbi:MAG: VWA domain-containing protein [Acidobacteria bacterium]|nr:VWA domain-containing protein [Acidobacteriota bacterium]